MVDRTPLIFMQLHTHKESRVKKKSPHVPPASLAM